MSISMKGSANLRRRGGTEYNTGDWFGDLLYRSHNDVAYLEKITGRSFSL
jgi:hypothetical protein